MRRQTQAFALGLVAIFSFEAVDLFFISRLGDAPLAAVSFTFPITWLIYGIGIGFEAGTASVVSRAIGRRDLGMAARLTTDSVVLATLVLGLMGVIGLMTITPVFGLLGATPELMPLIHDYMVVWYWVAPLDACLWTCLASLRARGRADLEAKIITAAALLNLVLDPIFIFGLFGFPRLEVMGAALATVVANAIITVYTLWFLGVKMKMFANPFAPIATILQSWKHMLSIGLPAVFTNAIIPLSAAIVVSMVAVYGVDAVAGFGVAARIEPFALLIFYSMSAVVSPFFGQNFGAGNFDRLLEARRLVARFCVAYGISLAILLAFLAKPLTGMFSESDSIREVATHYLWLMSLGYGAHGITMSMNAAFNGTGRPLPAVVVTSSRVIILFLPLALLGRWLFGLEGIFAAGAVCNILLALLAWWWLGRHIEQASREHDVGASPAVVASHARD
ncbi:MAG TPA: MATE family efflux transporter [Xanthomonadales bacterium]|nr:MATE family efflux transporter [Xanthomonadales bacterium]